MTHTPAHRPATTSPVAGLTCPACFHLWTLHTATGCTAHDLLTVAAYFNGTTCDCTEEPMTNQYSAAQYDRAAAEWSNARTRLDTALDEVGKAEVALHAAEDRLQAQEAVPGLPAYYHAGQMLAGHPCRIGDHCRVCHPDGPPF